MLGVLAWVFAWVLLGVGWGFAWVLLRVDWGFAMAWLGFGLAFGWVLLCLSVLYVVVVVVCLGLIWGCLGLGFFCFCCPWPLVLGPLVLGLG